MASPDDTRLPTRSTWASRLGAFFLSSVLTLLWVWLLAFLLGDLGKIDRPEYDQLYEAQMPAELLQQQAEVGEQMLELEKRTSRLAQLQGDLERDMEQSGEVMRQMMDLQRLGLEKGEPPSDEERAALAAAQSTFLSSQESYRAANGEIQAANLTLFQLRERQRELAAAESEAAAPIRKAYAVELRARDFREAALRLGLVVPLFVLTAFLVVRRWSSPWRPVHLSALVATFWTLGVEMFERFPAEFFKYIAIVTAIAITLGFLGWLIRKATSPSPALALARHRAAYTENVCPVCAFQLARAPIQGRGPRWRWSRPAAEGPVPVPDRKAFSCPSCGTGLFEACPSCDSARHTLLPFCEGCGAGRAEAPAEAPAGA